MVGGGSGRRHLVAFGNVEGLAVRHDAAALEKTQLSVCQSFSVDIQVRYAPIRILRTGKPKLNIVLKKLILGLEMLRCQKHSLRPNDAMPILHGPYISCPWLRKMARISSRNGSRS